MARYMRQYGQSDLHPPAVIGAGIAWHGPGTYLTYPTVGFRNRKQPHYRLQPPAVVNQPGVFSGPKVNLNVMLPERLRNTVTRKRPTYSLGPPVVVGAGISFHGPRVLNTRSYRRPAKSFLRQFIPTAAAGVFFGPKRVPPWIRLGAGWRRYASHARLQPPAVVGAPIAWHGPGTYLTRPSRPIPTHSHLPQVVPPGVAQAFYGPAVHLTRIRPPKVHPTYIYPLVISRRDAFGYLAVQLVIRPRPKTLSTLRPPAVLVAAQYFYGPAVHLARARRPVAKSHLSAPAILASTGPSQYSLAYSRRGKPRSFLRPPTDTIGLEDQGKVSTHLVRQHRTVARYRLSAPAVVVQPGVFYGPQTALAYSRRGVAKPHLFPSLPEQQVTFFTEDITLVRIRPRPTTYFYVFAPLSQQAVEIYGPQVTLARIRPRPTTTFLNPFAARAFEVSLGPETHLTYSSRRRGIADLKPPAVVGAIVYYGPTTTLAPQRRGIPKPRLKPPAVVNQPPAYQQVVPPTLAPQRRGRPTSFLNPPTVVFPFFARRTDTTFAPQFRGRPTSFLSPPAILRERGRVEVTLAPQRRGRPLSVLRPPRVVRLAVEIYGPAVKITYSRRGRPLSSLQPPTIVGRPPFRGILTHLAYSRRGRGFIVRQPELQKVLFRGLLVHLTYSRRGKPRSFLRPPAVVRRLQAGTLSVHLTRITPRPTTTFLKPPTVVGEPNRYFGPKVTLVRIKHPPVGYHLRLTLVAFRRPQGNVCGFDIAGSFVCEVQVPGSAVSGSDSAVHGVSGTSQAGSTITGADSAGGSVSGSDRKAT